MAKKGEYKIVFEHLPFELKSPVRPYGVMFSPSASRSRLGIVDSGRRYEIRLDWKMDKKKGVDILTGTVAYSIDGKTWRRIIPFKDPCSGWEADSERFLSFNNRRSGESLGDGIRFDMIAVGRGRVLAKEKGKDRIFHLVMDELFRTHDRQLKDCHLTAIDPTRKEDPPVPGSYWKLDPEFFTTEIASVIVPDEVLTNYAAHPASLRFPVFAELLVSGMIDGFLVTQKPREWHLIDARSPLMIIGPEDLKIDEGRFKREFTAFPNRNVIYDILNEIFHANEAGISLFIREKLKEKLTEILEEILSSNPMATAARDALRLFIPTDVLDSIAGRVPLVAAEVLDASIQWIEDVFQIAPFATEIRDFLIKSILETIAEQVKEAIRNEGFGALVLPANFAMLLFLNKLREGDEGEKAIEVINDRLSISPSRFFRALNEMPSIQTLDGKIRSLMEHARRSYMRENGYFEPPAPDWVSTPNPPLPGVDIYRQIAYEKTTDIVLPPTVGGTTVHVIADSQARFAVKYTKVLDLGVGYSHWSEQWQLAYGGEIHSLLATRPMAQQAGYNLLQYRFLNGPVIDGDGYNDGTCNFYMLVKLKTNYLDSSTNSLASPINTFSTPLSFLKEPITFRVPVHKYGILWIDEQTYFTQRWRLLDPTEDTMGDLVSLQRTMKEHPEWFCFERNKFWSPFEAGLINDDSRMLVRRQLIAVTTFSKKEREHAISTICFSFGVCDHTWRWRLFPPGEKKKLNADSLVRSMNPQAGCLLPEVEALEDDAIYVNTLDLRDDLTLTVRGYKRVNTGTEWTDAAGRWFQQYLPSDCRHVPHRIQLQPQRKPEIGYSHDWHFFEEKAYKRADHFYQMGVYKTIINTRCQYYELEMLKNESGEMPDLDKITGRVWRNDAELDNIPLFFNTENFNWSLEKRSDGYIPLDSMVKSKRRNKTLSMYEKTTRFLLLERKPKGLIAIFFDKRDDELQEASHLPHVITLQEEEMDSLVPESLRDNESFDAEIFDSVPRYNAEAPQQIRVLVKQNHRVNFPPSVKKATIMVNKDSSGITQSLEIRFWTPLTPEEVYQNIWKLTLAALSDDNNIIKLYQGLCFSDFTRLGIPDGPRPAFDAHPFDNNYCYQSTLSNLSAQLRTEIDKYCSNEGRYLFATSLWFEDIVGHCATPETIEFL